MATITNEDWNPVVNKIRSVVGTPDGTLNDLGYNTTPNANTVNDLQVITGAQWNALRADVNRAYTLQTGSNSDLTTRGTLDKITTTDLTTMSARVDTAYNNRTSVDTGQLTAVNKTGYSFSGGWSSTLSGSGNISWSSNSTYRGFWNAGGRIVFSFSRSGGSSNSQNQSWSNLCTNTGSLVLTRTGMSQSGQTWNGTFSNSWNTGAYGRRSTSAEQAFIIYAQDTNYTANYIQLLLSWNDADIKSATTLNWTINFVDNHTPLGSSTGSETRQITGEFDYQNQFNQGPTGFGPDTVDGTTEMAIVAFYPFSNQPS